LHFKITNTNVNSILNLKGYDKFPFEELKIYFFREELDQWVKEKRRISKKEILDEADNLKFGSHGGK